MEQTFPKQKYTSIETAELERLRAQVSKVSMAPHTFAQMVNRVRDLGFDFGTTEQFRDRVSELLGEYVDDRVPREPERRAVEESGPVPDYTGEGSAWVPPVGARAVVVPEPRAEDWWNTVLARRKQEDKMYREAHEEGFKDAIAWVKNNARAIPADRVLGERMVAMDPKTLGCAADFLEEFASRVPGISAVIAALRTSQGGPAT